MRICILENDAIPKDFAPPGTRLADYYARLLADNGGTGWHFDSFHTPAGEYPTRFDDYDAIVLTGSRDDSFADTPWVADLRARLSTLIAARKTLIGICFGHQILALCLGAPVTRAPGGLIIGRQDYAWHGDSGAASYSLLATHQDQVRELPPGAVLLASSPACPIAGYRVGDHIFAIQPHPELDAAILATLIELRRDRLGDARANAALASLAAGHDGDAMGREIVAFIRQHAALRSRAAIVNPVVSA